MDPQTIDTLLLLGKLFLIMGGGCACVMAILYAIVAGAVNYYQRKDRRDQLMPLYAAGEIATKPTILNAYSISGHAS
jgi:hypothetical protein